MAVVSAPPAVEPIPGQPLPAGAATSSLYGGATVTLAASAFKVCPTQRAVTPTEEARSRPVCGLWHARTAVRWGCPYR
jgi:hypothetical protein